MRGKNGTTLIEVLIAMAVISVLGLATMPFVFQGKRYLKRAQAKRICMEVVQNKLKDYRSAKIWGIDENTVTVGDQLDINSRHPTSAFKNNTSFAWMKNRFNLVLSQNAEGCVDPQAPPGSGNIFGLRENLANHGPPGVGATEIPGNSCPEEPGGAFACQGPGVLDQTVQQQLGGQQLLLYVNYQLESRAPQPDPQSPFFQYNDGFGGTFGLADLYTGAGVGTSGAPISQAGVGVLGTVLGGPAACAFTTYNADPTDAMYDAPPFLADATNCPVGLPETFQDSRLGVKVIVTGAVQVPAGGLWGFGQDVALPDGLQTNRQLMCQAEELIVPDEAPIRFYVRSGNIFDRSGSQVLHNVSTSGAGPNLVSISVAPDGSRVYGAYNNGVIEGFNVCGFGSGANPGVYDCSNAAGDVFTWSLGVSISGMGIDFINFPDVFIVKVSGAGGQFMDFRFDPNRTEQICGQWNMSARLSQIPSANLDFGLIPISSVVISPMNGILFYRPGIGRNDLVFSAVNDSFPFFQFSDVAISLDAISQ